MREVKTGSQFRKDLKRYRNDNTKLEKLYDIVGYLERCEDVPKEFKPHMLSGDYAGHMECHVENDSDYPFMHLLYSQLLVCQRVCLQNTVCLICK